jgi:tRNA(Ile)-lysidine synthase
VTRAPEVDRRWLRAGVRVAVAVSGGSDSVGLLRALAQAAPEIGLVLAVAHVHHGIRGAEADEDARFVEALARQVRIEFLVRRVDTLRAAQEKKQSLEEAARELRYSWFRELMAEGKVDAVATAHTLDDQAETVLHRLLRGAWTEGLGGIYPVVACTRGAILRPFLEMRRAEIRAWLRDMGQAWREDATNEDVTHTRNRIRQELMPKLRVFNPQIAEQLAHIAAIARDEESWWEQELRKLLPGLVLPGKPVRGGGRAVPTNPDEGSLGMELERVRGLAPALRRRILRAAAEQLRCGLNFDQTERLMAMVDAGAARRQQLTAELWAERTARELRLRRKAPSILKEMAPEPVEVRVPGEATALGVTVRVKMADGASADGVVGAILRVPRAGDRVRLRYSRGAKPLKQIFERMNVEAEERKTWPLLEWAGRIVWMKGVEVETEAVPLAIEVVPDEGRMLPGL